MKFETFRTRGAQILGQTGSWTPGRLQAQYLTMVRTSLNILDALHPDVLQS